MVSVLQVMAGARVGGAEAFFERLVTALPKERIQQTILLRSNLKREAKLRDCGLDTRSLSFGGPWDFTTRGQIRRVIGERHPKVVLAWMNRAASRCPRTVAGEHFALVGRLGGYYNLKYYARCHHLIANTQGIRDYLLSGGWPSERVHHLPNFVDACAGPPALRQRWGPGAEGPLLLAAGRLHANKGFDVLIRTLASIPDARLCIAGAGPLKAALKKLALDLGVAPRLRWLGWVDDLGPLYRAADVYVCSSRHEPLGNVIIEAWANGCPVVATASEGPTELIDHGVNGFLVPIDDHKRLATVVKEVVGQSNAGSRVIEMGSRRIAKTFRGTLS